MVYMDAALEQIEEVIRCIDADHGTFPDETGEMLEIRLMLLTADYVLWEIATQSAAETRATLEAFREPYGTRLVVCDADDALQVLAQLQDFIDTRSSGT